MTENDRKAMQTFKKIKIIIFKSVNSEKFGINIEFS